MKVLILNGSPRKEDGVSVSEMPVADRNGCDQDALCAPEKPRLYEMTDDEKVDAAAARILEKYKSAFIELAK